MCVHILSPSERGHGFVPGGYALHWGPLHRLGTVHEVVTLVVKERLNRQRLQKLVVCNEVPNAEGGCALRYS